MITKNLNKLTLDNTDFRRVLITNSHSQLVLMCINPGEEIGEEEHDLDQILYFVAGSGKAVFEGREEEFAAGDVANVPATTKHNFINTGEVPLKLFTIYSPPEHENATVHKTKAEADAAEH
ncbi:MAG TPA: cupin domain-containing protein [Candidatus Doudnabacteria bacterium]|nr:cupin domain-containing protein [Candidatus Doudnabacteria bacterium]